MCCSNHLDLRKKKGKKDGDKLFLVCKEIDEKKKDKKKCKKKDKKKDRKRDRKKCKKKKKKLFVCKEVKD